MKLFRVIAAALLIIASSAKAQKCVETADPVTNEKSVVFQGKDKWISTRYELKGGQLTLAQALYYDGAISGTAPAGLEFVFKLENGDLITLKSISESTGKANVSGVGVVTYFTFIFNLDKENVNKFAASPVVFLRRPKLLSEGTEDLDKKHYNIKYLDGPVQKGAACIGAYM